MNRHNSILSENENESTNQGQSRSSPWKPASEIENLETGLHKLQLNSLNNSTAVFPIKSLICAGLQQIKYHCLQIKCKSFSEMKKMQNSVTMM